MRYSKFLLFGICILLFGCKKNEVFPTLVKPELREPVPWTEESATSEVKGQISCEIKKIKWGPEHPELISMDPQGEVIYPGAIIDFDSYDEGKYIPIVGDRKPITLSISLSNLSGKISSQVEDPKLSTVREAIQGILNSKSGQNAAFISWNNHEFYSEEHFNLDIAANYGNLFGDVKASFNFNDNEILSRYLLEFNQVYYSIDLDLPQPGLENYFNKVPNQAPTSSPVYISSVTYGRKVFFIVESKTLESGQAASLETSFKAFGGSGHFKADETLKKLIREKSIRGLIIGGPSTSAIEAIVDETKLKEYLLEGANYSNESPGVPLSYNLRFVIDNSIASLVQYGEFTQRTCKITTTPEICYYLHVRDLGNTVERCSGEGSDQTEIITPNNINERGEGFAIYQHAGTTPINLRYRGYLQGTGWTSWVNLGNYCGTTGEDRRLEAMEVEVTGSDAQKFNINYQAYVNEVGWTGPCQNGQLCGTTGKAQPIIKFKAWVTWK